MNIPTTAEIREFLINAWEQRLSASQGISVSILRSITKSVFMILATVLASPFRLNYFFVQWALNQTDPQTADDENAVLGGRLQQWGRLVKVGDPKPGQAPRYEIDITGTNGSTLLAGTAYRSATGNLYLLEEDIIIAAGVATGNIKATVPEGRQNTEYALTVGAEINTANPFSGIDNPAIIAAELTPPTDSEDIETSYRPRVVSEVRIANQGGAKIDYKRWPLDAEGVQEAYPYVDSIEPGIMNVFIQATTDIDPDGIPDAPTLAAALAAITTDPDTGLERKPATDIVYVFAIDLLLFDIDVIGLDAPDPVAAQTAISDALIPFISAKKPYIAGADFTDEKNDIASRSEIIAVIVATLDPLDGTITDVTLELATVPIDSHTLDNGEKGKVGSLTFS